jgi:hypothetical protein
MCSLLRFDLSCDPVAGSMPTRVLNNSVTFELTRYEVGGKVTDRDVEVAKKISSLYRTRG